MAIECKCNGWDLWVATPVLERKSVLPRKYEDGYILCPFCSKIEADGFLSGILAECDVCDKKFKGYRKYPKIAYTCEDCE